MSYVPAMIFGNEGLSGSLVRLQDVSGPSQEIIWHSNPVKMVIWSFFNQVFVQIKQTF